MILRLPLVPMLPMIAAAPPGHHQNPIMVRKVEELVGLKLAFKANRVQTKVADMTHLVLHALTVHAQKHVGRPAATANQDVAMVDVKELVSLRSLLRRDFANAKLRACRVGERCCR